jgi:uncharacterized protein YvpB
MKNHNENTHATTDKWLLSIAIILVVMLCLIACCFAVFFYLNPPIILTDPNSGQEQMIIFPNAAGEMTSTPFLPMPTPTQTPTPTPTPTPLPTPTRQPTNTPFPAGAQIRGVYGNAQQYSLDCEARSAVDWAAYYGYRIVESDFLNRLPRSDDPESGFVGNLNGYLGQLPPKSYGVHAGPIASVLRTFGLNAQAVKGFSWDDLKNEILANKPVIVWVVNYPYSIESRQYTAPSTGKTTTVARFEHTWMISGYNSWSVTVVDGEYTYQIDLNDFLSRWAALGNMVVVLR